MKTSLFTISLLALTAIIHTDYISAAAAPAPINPIQSRMLRCHTASISSIAFSSDGSKIATGSWDNTVCIWDTGSGNLLHTLNHERCVSSVAFSPDGSKIVTGSYDSIARIWDTRLGNLLHTLTRIR